jgi:hypothetical protein
MFVDDTEGTSTDLDADHHVMSRGHYATDRSYTMTRISDDSDPAATVGPTGAVGTDTGHNNIPPFAACFVFIKT